MECPHCLKFIEDSNYNWHERRCYQVNTIIRDMKRYFDLELNKDELFKMNETKFEQTYFRYLNKIVDVDLPDVRKKVILKLLYPNSNINIKDLV